MAEDDGWTSVCDECAESAPAERRARIQKNARRGPGELWFPGSDHVTAFADRTARLLLLADRTFVVTVIRDPSWAGSAA